MPRWTRRWRRDVQNAAVATCTARAWRAPRRHPRQRHTSLRAVVDHARNFSSFRMRHGVARSWTRCSRPSRRQSVGIRSRRTRAMSRSPFAGLHALRTPETVLASFPTAFRNGIAARRPPRRHGFMCSEHVGGRVRNRYHPRARHHPRTRSFRPVGAARPAPGPCCRSRCRRRQRTPRRSPATPKNTSATSTASASPLSPTAAFPPMAKGTSECSNAGTTFLPGEIFHGHLDDDGYPSPAPPEPFGHNGTFVVWRKLRQDVAQFRTWVHEQASSLGMDESLLRAKLVGRWDDGTPLALVLRARTPRIASDGDRRDAFDYRDDPDGFRCPLGAHIRRTTRAPVSVVVVVPA